MERPESDHKSKSSSNLSHPDPSMDTDYRPTRYGSTDSDRLKGDSHQEKTPHTHMGKEAYLGLVPMLISHFLIMFAVMYTMVDKWEDVFINLNQFYMTMMMVTPMTMGMLLFMRAMYPNKKLNTILHAASIVAFGAFFSFMRAQSFVGDEQFLKSMIPHHSGAILMCEKAQLSNPEIIKFCDVIIQTQQDEIATMKAMLKKY
jgi:hypothetical protein